MGYYIETGTRHGKAEQIMDTFDAIEISQDEARIFLEEGADCAIICVVDNGPFEAAAYCHSLKEFQQFTLPQDDRPKTWLMVPDRAQIETTTGYRS